jgi:hypothetical protein
MANQIREDRIALAGASSEPIFIQSRARHVSAKVIPVSGGSAVVEFTLDDPIAVAADPDNADWEEWEPGAVTEATSRAVAGTVTALRATAAAQNATLQVVAAIDY